MKKVMFCLAVAGMFAFAACNNTKTEEPVTDATEAPAAVEAACEEATTDTTAVAETVATEENTEVAAQ